MKPTVLLRIGWLALGLACLFHASQAMALERNVSGSWYDPQRDGEGLVIDLLDESRATVYWFTYDNNGNQMWLFGVGDINGNTIQVDLLRPQGGEFGIGFDPETVTAPAWGSATLTFTACRSATLDYAGPGSFGSGSISLERLAPVAGASCQSPAAPAGFIGGISGGWYDPSHDGEGFLLQWLDGDRALLYWFTYDQSGNQAWLITVADRIGSRLLAVDRSDSTITRGARFGGAFDPGDVARTRWGRLSLIFSDCDSGILRYEGAPRFGAGRQTLTRLFATRGTNCTDGGAPTRRPAYLSLAPEAGNAVSGTATPDDGLTLSTSANDGTTMALDIPAGAVIADTRVTLTPARQSGPGPFRGGANVAAQIEPHGLTLFEPATLTFGNLPGGLAGDARAFEFRDLGDDAHLTVHQGSGDEITVMMSHFSGAGATNADSGPIIESVIPADPRAAASQELGGHLDDGTLTPGNAAQVMQDYFENDVVPALEGAEANHNLFDNAVSIFNDWRELVEILAFIEFFDTPWANQFNDEIQSALDSLARALDEAVGQANLDCVVNRDVTEVARIMRWYAVGEALELYGRQGLTRASVRQAVRDCARFRLVVDVLVESATPNGLIRSVAQARVPLELDNALQKHSGTGIFEYVELSETLAELPCSGLAGEDGQFTVRPTSLFNPSAGYGNQPAPRIEYTFNRMEENWETACPLPGPGPHPFESFVHLTAGWVTGQVLSPDVDLIGGEGNPDSRFAIGPFTRTGPGGFGSLGFRQNVVDETGQIDVSGDFRLEHAPRATP